MPENPELTAIAAVAAEPLMKLLRLIGLRNVLFFSQFIHILSFSVETVAPLTTADVSVSALLGFSHRKIDPCGSHLAYSFLFQIPLLR